MMPIEKIALNVNFADFGFDSISLTSLSTELADVFKTRITPDVFFSYPTVSKLAKFIADKDNVKQEFAKYSESIIPEENTSDNREQIDIEAIKRSLDEADAEEIRKAEELRKEEIQAKLNEKLSNFYKNIS